MKLRPSWFMNHELAMLRVRRSLELCEFHHKFRSLRHSVACRSPTKQGVYQYQNSCLRTYDKPSSRLVGVSRFQMVLHAV